MADQLFKCKLGAINTPNATIVDCLASAHNVTSNMVGLRETGLYRFSNSFEQKLARLPI